MEVEEEPCPPFQRLEDFDPFDEDAFTRSEAGAWVTRERALRRIRKRRWVKGKVTEEHPDQGYFLEYPGRDDHPGIWMTVPFVGWQDDDGTPWDPIKYPLLDPLEALIGPFRWGKVARSIVACLMTGGHTGSRVFEGFNRADAIEQAIAVRENREPIDFSTAEPTDVANRHKTINTALNQLLDYGYLWGFVDLDTDSRTLLRGTGLLLSEMPDLISRHHDEFLSVDETNAVGLERFPYVARANPNPRSVAEYAEQDYANIDVARWDVPVTTKGARSQPSHVVARGVPVGDRFETLASSVHQVSEIISTSALGQYVTSGPKVGLAIAELGVHVEAKSIEDVTQGILLLTAKDQMDVYDYVGQFLTERQTKDLRLSQFEGTQPVDLIHQAVEMVPTKDGQRRHVLRQIRLLVAQLCQSLIGIWSGQILEARPRSDTREQR